MSEFNQVFIIVIPFLAYALSYFGRKFLFVKKNITQVYAMIDKIQVHQIDNIWLPEVQVTYSFYAEGIQYTGKDFIRMDQFLGASYFLLTNQNGLPVVSSAEGQYIGEECIEHYLLEKNAEIYIEYYQKKPFENRIYKKQEESGDLLFTNKLLNFPWVN